MAEQETKSTRLQNLAATARVAPMIGEQPYKGYQSQLPAGFANAAEEEAYWRNRGQDYRNIRGETFSSALQSIPTMPKVDLSEIIKRRASQLGGYNAEESAAMRSQMAAGLARQQQQAQRQLAAAQARSGVRGGAAATQGQQLLQNLGQIRNVAEQELFIKNVAEQQRRQKEYEDLRKQEQFAGVAGDLARMQMAAAELQGRRGMQIAAEQAAAMRDAARSGSGGGPNLSGALQWANPANWPYAVWSSIGNLF